MPESALPGDEYLHRAMAEQLRAEAAIAEAPPAVIAQRTGINAPTVRRILRGERPVTVVELLQICDMLRLSFDATVARALARARDLERDDESSRPLPSF